MTDAAGVSRPVSARSRMWAAAGAELAPAKSLARVDERAKQIVTNVSLVGSLLTGLGLVAGAKLDRSTPAKTLAIAAVCAALFAIVVALTSMLLRFTPALTPANVLEVEEWYRRQFRWAYGVIAGGVLLLVAVLLAGAAALVVLIGAGGADEPAVSAQIAGTGTDAKLTAQVGFTGATPGQTLYTEVVGVDAAGSRTILVQSVTRAGDTASVASTAEVAGVSRYAAIELTATLADRRCTARLVPVVPPSRPTVVCERR
ncbi:hypothetical protein [Actinoplanes sp. NPDC049118]|uniref:hypothetical protein n=1 Tax=Actinoplanes sp. NPDC049118 TaxID=3155769 RepID=UPI0033C6FFD1